MIPEIVLIFGHPGSGKTTMAKNMNGYVHIEADMYLDVDGKHVYDAAKVPNAHDMCVAGATVALERLGIWTPCARKPETFARLQPLDINRRPIQIVHSTR